jgi:hypothetical protein
MPSGPDRGSAPSKRVRGMYMLWVVSQHVYQYFCEYNDLCRMIETDFDSEGPTPGARCAVTRTRPIV